MSRQGFGERRRLPVCPFAGRTEAARAALVPVQFLQKLADAALGLEPDGGERPIANDKSGANLGPKLKGVGMNWRRPKLLVFPGRFDGKHLPAIDDYHLRGLTMRDLLELMAGNKPGSYQRLATEADLRRREGWVARWSLFFSLVAVVVSIFALVRRTT